MLWMATSIVVLSTKRSTWFALDDQDQLEPSRRFSSGSKSASSNPLSGFPFWVNSRLSVPVPAALNQTLVDCAGGERAEADARLRIAAGPGRPSGSSPSLTICAQPVDELHRRTTQLGTDRQSTTAISKDDPCIVSSGMTHVDGTRGEPARCRSNETDRHRIGRRQAVRQAAPVERFARSSLIPRSAEVLAVPREEFMKRVGVLLRAMLFNGVNTSQRRQPADHRPGQLSLEPSTKPAPERVAGSGRIDDLPALGGGISKLLIRRQ